MAKVAFHPPHPTPRLIINHFRTPLSKNAHLFMPFNGVSDAGPHPPRAAAVYTS